MIVILGGSVVKLDLLPEKECFELLKNNSKEDIKYEDKVIKEIIKESGHLPLVISMIGN